MNKSSQKNLTTLKCSNCGSSTFEQTGDGIFKCTYCGTIVKDNDTEKESFIKFLNSKSNKQSKIFMVRSNTGKRNFFERAINYISLAKYSPEDVLTAKFDKVKTRYLYFLIVNADFKVATLSNTYFDDINYSDIRSNKISINSQMQTEEDVVNETMTICSPLSDKPIPGQSEKIYNDIYLEENPVSCINMGPEAIAEYKIKLPTKAKISGEIDRIVKETKAELLDSRTGSDKNNIRIMHCINQIELYIVPEYFLEYEYKNVKYEVCSYAYDLDIRGTIPNDSENLFRQVALKTAKYPLVSIALSALCAVFALLTHSFFRYKDLGWINIFVIPIMLIVFVSTFLIDKILTKRILTKRYNIKKHRLAEFLANNNIDFSNEKEFLNSFKGGE